MFYVWCSKGLGNLVTHPTALFLQAELLAAEFLLGTEQAWPGGWGATGKMELLFLLPLWLLSILFHCVAQVLKWHPEFSEMFLFVKSCLIIYMLLGGRDRG